MPAFGKSKTVLDRSRGAQRELTLLFGLTPDEDRTDLTHSPRSTPVPSGCANWTAIIDAASAANARPTLRTRKVKSVVNDRLSDDTPAAAAGDSAVGPARPVTAEPPAASSPAPAPTDPVEPPLRRRRGRTDPA